jgi:hypothetical protein
MAAAATASINNTTGNFMFHPRPAVFEHPITYNIPSSNNSTSTINNKSDKKDFPQYYISEQLFQTFVFFFLFFFLMNKYFYNFIFE